MIALLLLAGATLELKVSETAGFRRFDYPVGVKLSMPDDLTGKEKFRLLDGKKPVAAQFRPAGKREVWLDFTLSCDPLDVRKFVVEYGPDVEAGPGPVGGVTVTQEKEGFVVRTGGTTYKLDADIGKLFRGVSGTTAEYIVTGGEGLWIETKEGKTRVTGLKPTISRQGPFAAALAFSGKVGETDVTVDLTFPRSKSWAEVEVRAPTAKAVGAALKLDLAFPALVDFGAGTGVYVALKKGETAVLRGWSIVRPASSRWEVLVGGRRDVVGHGKPAEGWAHAMDRTRCTAVAVERFSGPAMPRDEIAIDSDGGLRLVKGYWRLHFWLHFVPMPVQVGAVTSPQSMMNPLKVEVRPR